ncbi:hypothetical protein B0H13DRAFT_1935878 [Mycena leptocephala]|nr:hypothetical protein B0H13DRAFT_1935878 [Mycena leptocephala]
MQEPETLSNLCDHALAGSVTFFKHRNGQQVICLSGFTFKLLSLKLIVYRGECSSKTGAEYGVHPIRSLYEPNVSRSSLAQSVTQSGSDGTQFFARRTWRDLGALPARNAGVESAPTDEGTECMAVEVREEKLVGEALARGNDLLLAVDEAEVGVGGVVQTQSAGAAAAATKGAWSTGVMERENRPIVRTILYISSTSGRSAGSAAKYRRKKSLAAGVRWNASTRWLSSSAR